VNKYPSIKTVYLRDPENKYRTLLEGQWACPEFEYLKDNEWVFTEKIDGTNIRVMWDGMQVRYGGRTDNAQMPTFLLDKLQDLFPSEQLAEVFPPDEQDGITASYDVCLYGEGYGAKIQKGGGNYIPDGVSFILFDVRVGDSWLERHNVEDIAGKLGVDVVPIIDTGCLEDAVEMARAGFRSKIAYADIDAEGLVMRPAVELVDRRGHRVIAKIKHKDFPNA
jgi:hypothetical protein